jgi:hypothetical protein
MRGFLGLGFGGWGLGFGIGLLLVSTAFGAVDGTVINQTTGKPQAGATVTLYKIGQAGPEAIESVKSGADGKFRIAQDATGPGPRAARRTALPWMFTIPRSSRATLRWINTWWCSNRRAAS